MSSPGESSSGQSLHIAAEELEVVRRLQQKLRCWAEEYSELQEHLLLLLTVPRDGSPPLVDGRPAVVSGEECHLTTWFCVELDEASREGPIGAIVERLKALADRDPREAFGEFIREDRRESARTDSTCGPTGRSACEES